MRFGNYFGRRLAILIGCTIVSIGAVLQSSAFGLTQLIIGRVICGMGTGINTCALLSHAATDSLLMPSVVRQSLHGKQKPPSLINEDQ